MKKQLLAPLIILGAVLLPAAAHSASFDCKKAATWVEKRVCANSELSKLDDAMAEKYKRDLANTSDYEDSGIFKDNMIIDQRRWLRFQRNTCADTECLIREYKEHIEDKNYNGVVWDFPNELNRSNLPNNNSFGEFSQDVEVPMYNSETNDWKVIAKTTNSVSIHRVANKPYLAIIDGILVFTNGHTCEIKESKATWSENHWVIDNDLQNETAELRLYPALYKGNTQLLLKDMDNKYREVHCGMRGYFDGIVLERE